MADPAGAEIEDAPRPREVVRVVFSQQGDGVVVDVRHEARGGVEICVRGFVFAEEIARGVRPGGVAGLVAVGWVGWWGGGAGAGGGGSGCGGCHCGEEGGEGEGEEGTGVEGADEVHFWGWDGRESRC